MTPEEIAAAEAAKAEGEGQEDKAAAGLLAAKTAETKRRQAAEARVAELEAAQTKREEEAAAKRGEFEQLYGTTKAELEAIRQERDTLAAEKTARTEAQKAANTERMKALPEHLRALVPDGLAPDTMAAQIGRLEKLAADAPTGGRTATGKKVKADIPAACTAEAAKHGRDPEWWHANVWLITHPPKT